MNKEILEIDVKSPVKSLHWQGNDLIDHVSGGRVFSLDGSIQESRIMLNYKFDSVVVSPCENYVVIYEKLGTKGLILKNGSLIREINRSYYCADVYEYPVLIFEDINGRVLLAHCPDDYNRIEFEDIETGKVLTQSENRKPSDFFQSRFSVSPNGKYLASAGWVWHPFEMVAIYEVEKSLSNCEHLDESSFFGSIDGEVSSVCFLPNSNLVVATSEETLNDGEVDEVTVDKNQLAVFDLNSEKLLSKVDLKEPVGTLVPINTKHVLGLYKYPKIFSLESGEIIKSWEQINTGLQNGSIIHHQEMPPPFAYDSKNGRFVVAADKKIIVVNLD